MKAGWLAVALVAAAARGQNAKPVGTVSAADASVSGPASGQPGVIQMVGGKSIVAGGATVTARAGHNAEVALHRGGSVLVCQTTALHMTPSADNSLLLALDRGAMEVRMKAGAGDVIMTPDLRFTTAGAGPLDLQMRVTFNGDTCVDNRGRKAPQLNISDSFGELSYLLKPGQHVMFEHGSLRTVEDRETTPCGCPPEEKQPAGLSLADALLTGGKSTPMTPQQAAAAHPFPTAVSDGLAPAAAPATPEAPDVRHVEVAGTLAFDPAEGRPATSADSSAPVAAPVPAQSAPAPTQPKSNPFSAIGRFFKRIFVR
jgi:hypothetical protein